MFDETYYAKDAYSLLRYGYERAIVAVPEDGTPIDAQMLAGRTDLFQSSDSYVVHPPLGKWMIAFGEWLFGLTPFGWRFGVALFGTLSVLLLFFIARRLFRSTLLGVIAGLLLALDGLAIVTSRTALLDGLLAFWLVAAFGCILLDRDRGRLKLLERYELARATGTLTPGGPRIGIRWWRVAAGVCFGLACATKWSGVFVLAACGLLVVAWDIAARKSLGLRRPYSAGIIYDGVPAFVVDGRRRRWCLPRLMDRVVPREQRHPGDQLARPALGRRARQPGAVDLRLKVRWQLPDWLAWIVPDALRSLWHYHSAALGFHNGLNLQDNRHPYASPPVALALPRPTDAVRVQRLLGRHLAPPDRRQRDAGGDLRCGPMRARRGRARDAGDLVGRLHRARGAALPLARPARLAGRRHPRAGRRDLAAVARCGRTGRSSSSTRSRSSRS